MNKLTSCFIFVSIVFSLFFDGNPLYSTIAEANGSNLLVNGGFESTSSVSGDAKWPGNEKVADWTAGVFTGTTASFAVDRTVVHEGVQSVRINNQSTNDRVALNQTVSLEAGKQYQLTVWTKLQNVVTTGNGVYVRRQIFDSNNVKIGNNLSSTKTSGTRDWSETEIVFTAPGNAHHMVIELFFDTGTGTAWFDDIVLKPYQSFMLDKRYASLEKGEQLTLAQVLYPETPNHTFSWSSSNPAIASVSSDGVVTGVNYGVTQITATSTTDSNVVAEAEISVETSEMMSNYSKIRQKVFEKLTVPAGVDPNASYVSDFIAGKLNLVQHDPGYWPTMDKSPTRTYLWSDRASTTDPYHIHYNYGRLKDMAFLYVMEGSPLYHNPTLRDDIVGGMEWIYENRYNERKDEYGNWFVWEIAIPQSLGELMVLMYDELTQEQRNKYIRAIDKFVPDPTKRMSAGNLTETGSNLINKAYDVALRGIVGESSAKIEQALEPIGSEYNSVMSGEGIYPDGSIIQHSYVAYTGGYGQTYVNQAEAFLYLFQHSPWEITDSRILNVFDLVGKAFEPLIYNGHLMQMINGRGIAGVGNGSAKPLILSILQLAETAPADKELDIKRMVKAWILADTVNNYTTEVTIYQRTLIDKLMSDTAITPRPELVKHQLFSSMDRTVHLRPGWGLGLSMFSDRVSAFEYGNLENIRGWYTGVGMTYLYNGDQTQYLDYYWPTIDSFRLPGTTTDRSGEGVTPVQWKGYMNTKTWVGGTSMDGLYGATGMDFSMSGVTGSSLVGKKSWFSFDDEVVALGSGISGGDNRNVETIVDNRKLNGTGSNNLTVDGATKPHGLGWSESMNRVHWAHLEGNTPDSGIGYYFPLASNVYGLREARTGKYADINGNIQLPPEAQIENTRNYLSLAFEHGVQPSNASYSYVLLPNKDSNATESYSNNPDIEVLGHTTDIHAVREKKLGITAANFWNPSTVSYITAYNPASVMVKETKDTMSVSIADPTQKQEQIAIDLEKSAKAVVQADPSIQIVQTSPTVKIVVNTSASLGKTYNVVFSMKRGSDSGRVSADR